MAKKPHIFFSIFLLMLILSSCSTSRNTWMSRNYQALATRFNIMFNGMEAYNTGLRNIAEANRDDFSNVIPLFPISNHANASAATSNMDRAIEKSRKAITTRSIRVKPQRNPRRWSDPAFREFYNQTEFNERLKDAWMLLGKAEFHKAEFLNAIGTFMYIQRLYPEDGDLVARAQLWMVRAYTEMGWYFEAEDILRKVNQDAMLSSTIGLFAAANATLHLARSEYREAIPFVQIMIARERNRPMRQRFNFVLAQLHEAVGNTNAAIQAYTTVLRMNPPYEMEFNARLNRAQLLAGNNLDRTLRDLNRMARNSNNKDFLDQIYYVIGRAYLNNNDTIRAIESFNRAAYFSTRNGLEKAAALIRLGDLHYEKRQYMLAEPPFTEASRIITAEHTDFMRVQRLADVLSDLVIQHETVLLQDSLQHLATLPRARQLDIINQVIANKIAEEQREQQRAERRAQQAQDQRTVPVGAPRGAQAGRWYFYNPEMVRQGQIEFKRIWGNRRLEDNWRRSNRTAALFEGFGDNIADRGTDIYDGETPTQEAEVIDERTPEFHLRRIPATSQQIAASNALIADALFAMGGIFKDRLNDFPMAVETYNEFIRRFGQDPRVPEAYFQLFLTELRQEQPAQAEIYRRRLLSSFPDTRYAQMVAEPDFFGRFHRMQQQQNELYAATYQAYINNQFQTVINNVEYARQNFPMSRLMPQFMFLETLTIGHTRSVAEFETALKQLIDEFPESEVSVMARDIAALIRQGREVEGEGAGTLITRRGDELRALMEEYGIVVSGDEAFSTNKRGKHRLMLISSAEQQEMFQFMFRVAAYNFTRFVIREFDLDLSRLDDDRQILSITGFEAFDEVVWYLNSMRNDINLSNYLTQLDVESVIISEENFALMRLLGFDDYLEFKAQYLDGVTVAREIVQQIIINEPQERLAPEEQETIVVETSGRQEVPVVETAPRVEEPAELFEGLFAYQPNAPHYVAIYIISGNLNFERFQSEVTAFNQANYTMLNLDIRLERVGNQQVIIIGSFGDANIARSYLLRIVQERVMTESLRGINHRNLVGTQRNLNVMMQNNALNAYMRFMQEFYR